MMLRVNGQFLDFNGDVDVEKRAKLFEKIDETLGDFSYSFELDKTSHNLRILGFPFPDVANKTIYKESNCDLMDESGIVIYKGFLRVQRINTIIEASFFSGNYNWISLLNGNLGDLDFSDLDTELTEFNIANTWDNESGIIFPIIDTGGLVTRSFANLMIEDFTGCIFIKDVFNKIFQSVSIKLQGDLFKDPEFNTMILCRNTKSTADIEDRTSYVKNNNDQVFVVPATSTTTTQIIFDNDSTYPFFDGVKDNYDTVAHTYTADVKMRGKIEISISSLTILGGSISDQRYIRTYRNGVIEFSKFIALTSEVPSISYDITLEAGDVIDVRFLIITAAGGATVNIHQNSTFKFTPSYVYFTSGKSLVPQWTKAEFVSNLLNLFCCICDYDPVTKTLTIDFFDNIKTKEPIDLSEFISIYDTDYEDFISGFNQQNLLTYQEADIEEIKKYNIQNFVKYGTGQILVDNDFISKTGSILDSKFKAPVSYINGAFSASLERVSFVEIDELDTTDFTAVVDSAGTARFTVPDDSIFEVGELVRVSESSDKSYNGDFVIQSTGSGSGFIVLRGNPFETNATGKITKLIHKINNDDSVYLFVQTKYKVDSVSRYSRLTDYYVLANQYPNVAYPFFNLLNTAVPINEEYKQSLSFGSVNDTLSYQRTLIDKYWGTVGRVLNDPVKLRANGNIPKTVFFKLTPLRPIRISTIESNNLYYLNSITGYKDSSRSCDIELIKLP